MKKFKVTVNGQTYTVAVEEMKEEQESASAKTSVKPLSPPSASSQDAKTEKPDKETETVTSSDATGKASGSASEGQVTEKAPMPGSVIEVKVKEGDQVREGDVLLVLEAMKMENEITASRGGTVARILVNQGDNVNSQEPLVELS